MIKDWRELAARLFCFCFFLILAYVCLEYLLYVLLPFVIAVAIGTCVYRASRSLSRLTGVSRKLCAFFINTLIMLFLGVAIFFACRHLAIELARLLGRISQFHKDDVLAPLRGVPVIGSVLEAFFTEDTQLKLVDLLTKGADILRPMLGRVVKGSPAVILSVAVTVISTYYVSIDTERIWEIVHSAVPSAYRKDLSLIKDSALFCFIGYLRAYACLFALTFFETLIGLLIIKPSYACIGAICIAAVDILPVLGAGFVLIPWGIFSIAAGDILSGVGLIALYVIITVVRQISEPRIVGERLGVHPFFVLMGTFIGARLFGVTGMLLSPVIISVFLQVSKKRKRPYGKLP